MRKHSLLFLAALAPVCAWAQSDDEDRKSSSPPVENLYFATDEFIYIPKYTFTFGMRSLGGGKSDFGGKGRIYSTSVFAADSLTDVVDGRYYYDGAVYTNARTDGNGTVTASDKMTNYFTYTYDSQESQAGYLAFHTYQAQVLDDGRKARDLNNVMGVEAACTRDIGKIWRIAVGFGGGVSLNDMTRGCMTEQSALITTLTDYYSLNGAAAPGPGSYPSSTTSLTYDAWGNPVYTDPPDNTTNSTQTVTDSPLITQTPSARTVVTSAGTITNYYHLKGSFYTIRMGPTFSIPFTAKLRGSLGFGAALLYAGGTFTVDSTLTPEIVLDTVDNDESISTISNQYTSVNKQFLGGYYVDFNLEYWLTERTGFYAGGVYQDAGTYKHSIKVDDIADYSTRVDLGSMSGYRMGMNYRF